MLPVNREFVVEYETVIPRSVGAYHLTVEVNEEVNVRRFVMSSDVDDDFVQTLTQDGGLFGAVPWDLRTRDNLEVAPGLYIYHVDAAETGTFVGRFAIVK